MIRNTIAGLFLLLLASCQSGDSPETLTVEGEVRGLKKGMLFLQQVQDSSLVTLDSVEIAGEGTFRLKTELSDPDMFYLYLQKADNNDINDRIPFFTGPGNIQVRTRWNAFEADAEISGSETYKRFQEYQRVQSRFNLQQLELSYAARQLDPQDSLALDSLQQRSDRIELRAYLYALNFAMNHEDSPLAPYIAVTEVADANPKVLDSIYSNLSPEVAQSKYGKQLKELLDTKEKEK